ncbi:MAG: hypothetical protein IKP69_02570, partial [Oscillospiraceae bacterium]|nr:hypothetical protein [Oscillospiraceae bacterium]
MKNDKKNNAQLKSNQIPDLPEVPSISNIDTLELEDLEDSFLAEMLETEPEAVLDIPSFSGLDTLDIESAAQFIDDLEEENTRKETPPEIPSCSSAEKEEKQETPVIPSFSDETDFEAPSPEIASEILSLENQENIPAIPSFLDETDSEP